MKRLSWSEFFEFVLLQLGIKKDTNQDVAFGLDATESKDWIQAIELLQVAVRKKQIKIDALEVKDLTFNLIELSACLLQMDLCLSKNKKHYKAYQLREKKFNEIEKQTHLEILYATVCAQENHKIILECLALIVKVDIKNLQIKSITQTLRVLEKQTQSFAQAMHRLEEAVFKNSPLYALFENDLFLAVCEIKPSNMQLAPYGYGPLKSSANTMIGRLKEQAERIEDKELKGIAFGLIHEYESLSRYMIFSASKILKAAFQVFYNNIDQFIKDIVQNPKIDDAILHQSLSCIFRALESIRFIANKKDSFTKNLQDAAKSTKKQLYKNLEKTSKGQVFLNLHQRMSAKQKLIMRSRFT